MKVHYGEGVATHTGPESCALRREASREALTGVCVGQVVSGESNVVRGANAVVAAEGNRGGCDSARIRTTPRRLGPWHAHTPPAREPDFLPMVKGLTWRGGNPASVPVRLTLPTDPA